MSDDRGRDRKRDPKVVERARARVRRRGRLHCEVCSWGPPPGLRDLRRDAANLVQAHHIVPLALGGEDVDSNIVMLCPNHHALAHVLGAGASRSGETKYWEGPRSRDAFMHEMSLVQSSDRAAWKRWLKLGRDYAQHLADEEMRRTRAFTVERGGQPR